MFDLLTEEELILVRENRINLHFKAGELIQKQGTFMSHVISVNAGLVKVYLENEGVNNAILRIVASTNFIGSPGIWGDQHYHFTVKAMTDSSVCFIRYETFKEILERNKRFAGACLNDFSRSVLSTYNRLIRLTCNQQPGKMAYTLLYLFDEVFGGKEKKISIGRQDLAEMSSLSRDSAVKILNDFQREGIILISGNDIELLKPEMLQRLQTFG
jgi:CRP/FNR family transcriptional regulator